MLERSAVPVIDTSWHPLVDGNAPAWASEWGQEREGVFASFTMGGVTQLMRWIPRAGS